MTSTVPCAESAPDTGRQPPRRSRFTATLRQRSLLIRLLAVSALVSVCSITATAWVVLNTTAVVLGKERGQALADDARIYDTLMGWAATHPDWSAVGPTVEQLGRRAGHRVVLTTGDGRMLADSDGDTAHPFQPPHDATATVNPLATDIGLSGGTTSDTQATTTDAQATTTTAIDPRAVGPFRLSAKDGQYLNGIAHRLTRCLQQEGIPSHVEVLPSGRPRVVAAGADNGGALRASLCPVEVLDAPVASESAALSTLNGLVDSCLRGRGVGAVRLTITGAWTQRTRTPPPASSVASCLATSRAQQLAPYVAPAAVLFVASHGRTATTFFDLSAANRLRIAGWAAAVLVITVTVTSLAGFRLVKPLRVLTTAAIRMEGGELSTRVPVRGQDEIARLSAAFNAMSERREQLETVRRAMTNDIAHELRTPSATCEAGWKRWRTASPGPTPTWWPRCWDRRCSCSTSSTTCATSRPPRPESCGSPRSRSRSTTCCRPSCVPRRRRPTRRGDPAPDGGSFDRGRRRPRPAAADGGQPGVERRAPHAGRRNGHPGRERRTSGGVPGK